jgi:hypothetical protein
MLAKDSHLLAEKNRPLVFQVFRGEVFFFIDEASKIGKFEIKALSSRFEIKAAGGVINVLEDKILVKCFENKLKIDLVKQKGKPSSEHILEDGFGFTIEAAGAFTKPLELTDYDFSRWEEFTNNIGHIRTYKAGNINIEEKVKLPGL